MEIIEHALIESLKHVEPAETIDISLARLLKAQAEEKRRYYQSLFRYYQSRFRISPEEFYASRIQGKDHTWEDEETYFDWISSLQMVREMDEEIEKLQEILARVED